jgi:OOP family OmpA-OmpF porin
MFLGVTGQYRRRCGHIGRAAACALALGCVSGALFAQSDQSQIEKVVFDAGALFDFDVYQLRPEGRSSLDDFVSRLKGTTLGMIRAVGHADRLGSEGYNQILSEDRAEAVKAYLVSKGIEPDRVRAEGRGATQPVTKPGECAGGKNAKVIACLQADRRVGIEVAGTRALTNWMAVIRPKMIVNQLAEKQMNRDQIESDWKQFRGGAKQQWCTPSDDLLDMIAGKRDQLAGEIQETCGITKDPAENRLSDWQGRQKEMAQPK